MHDFVTEPLISVIMPVYNLSGYVKEAIQSMIDQNYSNWELLVIDDGSTDQTSTQVEKFAVRDSRILLFKRQNAGNATQRNFGIDHSSGKYLAFLDGDDYYSSNFLESMVNTALQKEADLVIADYQKVTEVGQFSGKRIVTGLNFDTAYTSVWNKLYLRELWNEVRFPEGLSVEDLEVSVLLNLKSKVRVKNNEAMYYYRMRNTSVTHDPKMADSHVDIVQALTLLWQYLNKFDVVPSSLEQLCLFWNKQVFVHLYLSVHMASGFKQKVANANQVLSFLKESNSEIFHAKKILYSDNKLVQIKNSIIVSLFKVHQYRLAELFAQVVTRISGKE